jgi:hypothetical protein
VSASVAAAPASAEPATPAEAAPAADPVPAPDPMKPSVGRSAEIERLIEERR